MGSWNCTSERPLNCSFLLHGWQRENSVNFFGDYALYGFIDIYLIVFCVSKNFVISSKLVMVTVLQVYLELFVNKICERYFTEIQVESF